MTLQSVSVAANGPTASSQAPMNSLKDTQGESPRVTSGESVTKAGVGSRESSGTPDEGDADA